MPEWILFVFIFVFGCCIGSFLNVVVYRLPKEKSLVKPPSACPSCGKNIHFYDNIPLLSWIVLGRKCRYCKVPISPRYFLVELLTGVIFVGMFFLYFHTTLQPGIKPFLGHGGFVYLFHIILLACLIAASAIDIELWVIPLSICWFATAVGLVGSSLGTFVIEPDIIRGHLLLPSASVKIAALSAGALIGLVISLILLFTGLIKRSYESEYEQDLSESDTEQEPEQNINHRLEVCREILFLLPVVICSIGALKFIEHNPAASDWWVWFSQKPAIAGLLGSLWGYFVGCAVVWITRIFGTLAFGKEAMGMGDVHLMGAAGAVIGGPLVVVAFFIAPFFGLGWAGFHVFYKKIQQIPYGPFLSLGIFTVMILHDQILQYLINVFYL